MLSEVKNIYYRGTLSSCNYACSYCPFAKRKSTRSGLEKDKKHLHMFIEKMKRDVFSHPVGIFFVPYGEALIHEHYVQALAALSQFEHIAYVSCQTNLSFDIDAFVESIKNYGGDHSKIKLWATYHPEMIDANAFALKVAQAQKSIEICVGMVAIPGQVEEAQSFREALPENVYLWMNGKEREKHRYTVSEKRALEQIDPLFSYELAKHKVTQGCCSAGTESIFVQANGDVFPCNMNKHRLGNLYEVSGAWKPFECRRKSCNCFLAYIHRSDVSHSKYLGTGRYSRLPQRKPTLSAMFFDIDGTLTNTSGVITPEVITAIKHLSQKTKIYVATSRPYESAMQKCRPIRKWISGGVFGNGGLVMDKSLDFVQVHPLDEGAFARLKPIEKASLYSFEGQFYKAVLPAGKNSGESLKYMGMHQTREKNHVSYHAEGTSKLNGILQLCQANGFDSENVLVMGNSQNDLEMIRHFKNSVIPMTVDDDELIRVATYRLSVQQLAIFF